MAADEESPEPSGTSPAKAALNASDLVSRLPHRPRHAARIIGPGRVFLAHLTRLVEVCGVEAGFETRLYGQPTATAMRRSMAQGRTKPPL